MRPRTICLNRQTNNSDTDFVPKDKDAILVNGRQSDKADVMILKTVTLQEANSLLPIVREHFFRIQMLLTHLQKLQKDSISFDRLKLVIDGKSSQIKLLVKKLPKSKRRPNAKEIREIEELIEKEANELVRFGAVIKGFFPLHIDFLSSRNGQPIFLCWHGSESEIHHWHHIDDGLWFRHTVLGNSFFGQPMVH